MASRACHLVFRAPSCWSPHAPGYRLFDERFAFLFNSYYVAAGPRHARPKRGLITRPNAQDVAAYRAHVDAAVGALIEVRRRRTARRSSPIVEIGLHHEQQHQELLLTDILHAFAQNPTHPAYDDGWQCRRPRRGGDGYADIPPGIHQIGHDGEGFHFDNEAPQHRVLTQPVRIARALVTNARMARIHRRRRLCDARALAVRRLGARAQAEDWQAPGYWRESDGDWHAMTLGGLRPIDPARPVMHVSYYEADAFARWAGKHLPTEVGMGSRRARTS